LNNFNDIIFQLKTRINYSLPGEKIQLELAPAERKANYPDLNSIQDPKISAVAILLYPKNGEIFFPVIERVKYKGVHSGQLALPGGKKDKTDKDILNTAIRETKEEIGVEINEKNILGKLTELFIPPSNFLVTPCVAFSNTKPDFKINKTEVEKVYELSLNELCTQQIKTSFVRSSSDGKKILSPHFEVEGEVLWGATAMILNELRTIFKEITETVI
jgi:8-oxo-dGTP pyrophosphatase MutT (NUDIX family)